MIGVKRQPLASPQPAAKEISGKYVILAVLAVAITGAAASWFFRYNATHRAAEFWGSQPARLIRDAPRVALIRWFVASPPKTRDISKAPGMTHLRNALLEDRSFNWDEPVDAAPKAGGWKLTFSDPSRGEQFTIRFTTDCRGAVDDLNPMRRLISTEPISRGLCEVFDENMPESEDQSR
jgi:hypothetical protein